MEPVGENAGSRIPMLGLELFTDERSSIENQQAGRLGISLLRQPKYPIMDAPPGIHAWENRWHQRLVQFAIFGCAQSLRSRTVSGRCRFVRVRFPSAKSSKIECPAQTGGKNFTATNGQQANYSARLRSKRASLDRAFRRYLCLGVGLLGGRNTPQPHLYRALGWDVLDLCILAGHRPSS